MTEEEISEDLELQFGKPKNVTEQNVRWLKEMLEERVVDGEFDEDVKEPSLDAVALTIIAICNYPEKTFEELASKKPAIHYTPKHGSWLDIAEIELNMMTRQCLDRRIDNIELLRKELSAWESEKNNEEKKVNWHFRTKDARIKLASLYPKFK